MLNIKKTNESKITVLNINDTKSGELLLTASSPRYQRDYNDGELLLMANSPKY